MVTRGVKTRREGVRIVFDASAQIASGASVSSPTCVVARRSGPEEYEDVSAEFDPVVTYDAPTRSFDVLLGAAEEDAEQERGEYFVTPRAIVDGEPADFLVLELQDGPNAWRPYILTVSDVGVPLP